MARPTLKSAQGAVRDLLSAYRPLDGVPDELMDSDGSLRPAWTKLITAIAAMNPQELADRFAAGDQYLRDAGVFYRRYGVQDSAERDWPLSHMPVLVSEVEWQAIGAGLIQRADLLEQVVADLYGENRLVAEGHLPAELVAGNPEWLRPLVGAKPRSGHFLHFVAFDIGRGPKGQWWVLGDRTQAPSGAGFALENRIATSRIYSGHFAHTNVHRLAGFFRAFRDQLQDMREGTESRVGVLTPGPLNDTYFEHAYIARYLGFMLLEGEDLTVRDGHLLVRTVDGLKPVNVLWRRLDAAWADPLELNENSKLGTAGLLGAVRGGNLTLVNALGTGILESRAFLAFLPRISTALTGAPLAMPNIATWWCGQEDEREFVKANAAKMAIGSAHSTRPMFEPNDSSTTGEFARDERNETVESWIDQNAGALVGQESVSLSTTPTFENGILVPRPMGLRLFLARTRSGWQVMPGGFARIGSSGSATALALQSGGTTADVWVVSNKSVAPDSMMSSQTTPYSRQQPAVLPSRAADNLFWLGRYVERAEFAIRLSRSYNLRLVESGFEDTPLLSFVEAELEELGAGPADGLPQGIAMMLASASNAAGHVRDRFSIDGWLALHDLSKTVQQMRTSAKPGDDMARAMSVLLRKLSGFSGLVHENMYQSTGWHFLTIGQALERAASLASMLAAFADPHAPDGSLDLAVEAADSSMSHRTRFSVSTNRATVIDLLALDQLNPRSIMFQLNEMNSHIGQLPDGDADGRLSPLKRLLMRTMTSIATQTPETLDTKTLLAARQDFFRLSNQLSAAYLA